MLHGITKPSVYEKKSKGICGFIKERVWQPPFFKIIIYLFIQVVSLFVAYKDIDEEMEKQS